MAEWSEHVVQASDLEIHYHRAGDPTKPAILLLHGVMDNGLCWTAVAEDLQADFAVYMLDARGHGQTGAPLDGFSYSLLAKDVVAFIEALDLHQPFLFGHSMGAMTAAVVAAQIPGRVRAIVLEDPPFRDEPEVEARDEEAEAPFQQMLQWVTRLRALSPEERVAIGRKDNPLWSEAELVPWATSKVEFDLDVFRRWGRNVSWRETLAHIVCPVLLVTGDPASGAIVTPALASEAEQLLPGGEAAYIPGAGHCVHRDQYDKTMADVLAFLRRV